MDQLKYQDALNKDLPIGSGEIESAHRYVVQKKLKLSGAWWEIQNAEHMLALRINRANRKWDGYWGALAGQNILGYLHISLNRTRRMQKLRFGVEVGGKCEVCGHLLFSP